MGIGALEKRKQILFFGILIGGIIGLIVSSPTIYAIVEPHITITMDPGQTTKPFVINDDTGTEVFSVDVDGTITPSGDGGGGVTPGQDDGRFHFTFEQRAQITTILGDDSDDPIILQEFQIIPPAGLTVPGNMNFGLVDVLATLKRNVGSGSVSFGYQILETPFVGPPRDYDNLESVFTTSGSFVARGSASFNTEQDIAFLVLSVKNSNTTTQGEIKEMKASIDITLPPGFVIIQTI